MNIWTYGGGRVFRANWNTRIEGIEIYPANIDSYHSSFYNDIHVVDAYDHIQTGVQPGEFDLIILGDVLEHFTKEQALILLQTCIQKSRFVLLNIPIGTDWPQGAEYGNEFETHLKHMDNGGAGSFP